MKLLTNNNGNWDIYRKIDSKISEVYIIRIPKMFADHKIKAFIEKYNLIKNINLPKLSIVEEHINQNKKGIKTEDINYNQSRLYVSPNSVYIDKEILLDETKTFTLNNPIKKNSEYEEYRYRNKLKEITNFKEFLKSIKDQLLTVSEKGILIEYDSYFFGTEKENNIFSIDYRIIDLDNIYSDTGKITNELNELNISEFKKAIHLFITYFVVVGAQNRYIEILDSPETLY